MYVDLHPCFLLHKKAFRETSLLLEVFSERHGRVGLVAKGAARKKHRSPLQPFLPLQMAWSGRGELGNLINAEADGKPQSLSGERLFSGYYVNELLVRLLHRHDPCPELFRVYQQTLVELAETDCIDSTLRRFEKRLLEELGYGPILDHDVSSGEEIDPMAWYHYLEGRGPCVTHSAEVKGSGIKVKGETLLLLEAEGKLRKRESRIEAKRLMRYLLSPLLGNKPLHSRRIFETMKTKEDRNG